MSVKTEGRPSKYKPEYDDLAYRYCLLGATDKQLAEFFDVTEQTVNNWKRSQPSFFESLKKGKHVADAIVAEALYKRATGFRWIEDQAFKVKTISYNEQGRREEQEDIEVVQLEKAVPPDTAAAFIWLKNRRQDEWRDRRDIDISVKDYRVVPAAQELIEADADD